MYICTSNTLIYRLHQKSTIVVLVILGQTETVRIHKRLYPIIGRLQASLHKSINISANYALKCWDLCSYETFIGTHKTGYAMQNSVSIIVANTYAIKSLLRVIVP